MIIILRALITRKKTAEADSRNLKIQNEDPLVLGKWKRLTRQRYWEHDAMMIAKK